MEPVTTYTHFSIIDEGSLEAISLQASSEEEGQIMTRSEVIEVYLDNGFELHQPVSYYSQSKGGQVIVDTFIYRPVKDEPLTQQPKKARRLSFARLGDNVKNIVQEELGIKDRPDKNNKY